MPHSLADVHTPQDAIKERLFVNDGALPADTGSLIPSSPDENLDTLRARYNEHGYLFLKGLIPRDFVLKARERYFDFLAPTGVLKPGTPAVAGVYDSAQPISKFPGIGAGAVGGNGHPGEQAADFVDRALQAHSADWYAGEFCKAPELRDFIAKMTHWGENTLGIRRTLLRNNIPGTQAIGVHYDQIFLRHGEPTSVTAWVPIGDISVKGGGLIYLERGHTLGNELENEFTQKAKASGLTEEEARNAFNQNMMSTGLLADGPAEFGERHGRRWLVSAYEAGDVVLHNPFTIHASTINHDPDDVIRLATDLRFVDSSKPWDQRWNKVYELDDGV